ncbi:MAG: flavin-containing monooxygenase [Candidatus Promineifilaceae bacterium]
MSNVTKSYNTIVIGGGQAGLATGYYLQRQGLDFVILDAGKRIGDTWRTRWDSLRLFTPARYSSLPGMPFPASRLYIPSKDEMADYLVAYAERFDLPIELGIQIERLERKGERFVLAAGDTRFESDNVVIATGAYHSPRIPAFAADLSADILQLHSSEYRRPSQLRKGDVLVVGAANSGAEIALELSRTHHVCLSGRYPGSEPTRPGSAINNLVVPLMWFVFSHVLNVKTPIGRKVRPKLLSMGLPLGRVRPNDLLEAGVERVHERTVGVQDGLPVLADGCVVDVANVIWCTGFRPDYHWIDLPIFADDGYPLHERGVVTSAPGLYFVGLFFQTAATSALIGGVGRDASYIVKKIATRPVEAAAADRAWSSSRQTVGT